MTSIPNGNIENTNELASELKTYLNPDTKINLRGPSTSDKVYKDECVYCFDTPFSTGGLFVCCFQFVGLCSKHLDQYVKKTGYRLFLNMHKKKVELKEEGEPKDKIQRLCIKEETTEILDTYSLRFYPYIDQVLAIDSNYLDQSLVNICDSIIAHASADIQNRLQSGISAWDGEERIVSKGLEDLMQMDFQGTMPYDGWTCQETGCDLQENLWLNLSDGSIMCGRYAPMSGIKGNSHAKLHYEKTGFPFVLKLGTIEGNDADIFSYVDDAPVKDPYLKKHLAHFGLDISRFMKTEKTTLELELDANIKYEYSSIQEDGSKLQNVYGPGFTGLINLGSSCYINSVVQVLLIVPDFLKVYDKDADQIFASTEPIKCYEDFNFQTAKLIRCMSSGLYSHEIEDESGAVVNGIRPTQFRRSVGQNHIEFSTARQQDVEEYVRHLFEKIDKNVEGNINPVNSFRFQLVTRFEDASSGRVRYTTREELILSLPIPYDQCLETKNEVIGVHRRRISLNLCIEKMFGGEFIEGYVSPITAQSHGAVQMVRMGTFPKFLILQLQRFAHTANFEVKKLDIDVEVSNELDLGKYVSEGAQPGEQLLPDDEPQNDKVDQLMMLGFTRHQSKYALGKVNGDSNQAAEWLFMNVDDVPPEPSSNDGAAEENVNLAPKETPTGSSRYELCGIISHMGNSPHSGHYVAHIKKNDVWYIYNDEKVAISQNPPKSLGYLYVYKAIRADKQ